MQLRFVGVAPTRNSEQHIQSTDSMTVSADLGIGSNLCGCLTHMYLSEQMPPLPLIA